MPVCRTETPQWRNGDECWIFPRFGPKRTAENEGAFRTLGSTLGRGARLRRTPFAAPVAPSLHPAPSPPSPLASTRRAPAHPSCVRPRPVPPGTVRTRFCAPDAALPPSHATPSGLRPISRSAPLYGQRSDGAVECREHRPDAGRAPDHRDAPREQVSARRPNGQSAGSQVAPTANHYVLGLLHFKSVGLDGLQEHFPALRSMGLDDNGPGPGEP